MMRKMHHGYGPFPGQGFQIVSGAHSPDFRLKTPPVQTPGQLQGLALGAPEGEIFQEEDNTSGAG
jgi:hypothetical protein